MRTDDAFNQLSSAAATAGPAEVRRTITELQLARGELLARVDSLGGSPAPLAAFLAHEAATFTALIAAWREHVPDPAPAPQQPTVTSQTARPLNRASRKGY